MRPTTASPCTPASSREQHASRGPVSSTKSRGTECAADLALHWERVRGIEPPASSLGTAGTPSRRSGVGPVHGPDLRFRCHGSRRLAGHRARSRAKSDQDGISPPGALPTCAGAAAADGGGHASAGRRRDTIAAPQGDTARKWFSATEGAALVALRVEAGPCLSGWAGAPTGRPVDPRRPVTDQALVRRLTG